MPHCIVPAHQEQARVQSNSGNTAKAPAGFPAKASGFPSFEEAMRRLKQIAVAFAVVSAGF